MISSKDERCIALIKEAVHRPNCPAESRWENKWKIDNKMDVWFSSTTCLLHHLCKLATGDFDSLNHWAPLCLLLKQKSGNILYFIVNKPRKRTKIKKQIYPFSSHCLVQRSQILTYILCLSAAGLHCLPNTHQRGYRVTCSFRTMNDGVTQPCYGKYLL